MPRRLRPTDLIPALLAAGGLVLALQALRAGSLFRYVLAGCTAGALLAVPLLSVLLLRERARWFWRRTVFLLLPLLASLGLVELGVRCFGPAPGLPARLVADARLGHVIAPGTQGTDGEGFRNPAVPEHTDVLFVGDSQTWGFQVEAPATMAAVFAARSGASSYQMANGSYGPVQYCELLRRGLARQPRLVVVGLYFGNDLVDARDYAGLDGAEAVRTPGRQYTVRHNPEFDGSHAPNWTMALVDAALGASRVLDFAANVVKSRLRGGVLDHQPGAVPFADARVGTILLPEYRRPIVDPADPHVADGLAITGRCLADIARRSRTAGADCVLLAIPTKEFAYQEWLRRRGTALPGLAALHAAESAARQVVFAAAAAAEMPVLDLAEPCAAGLAAGTAMWPPTGDGHLAAAGHAAAAELVLQHWQRSGARERYPARVR